jgi:SAM-dependent methyltransferase
VTDERAKDWSPPPGRRDALRATFDEVAELYDRARPRYPEELVDDLVALAGLRRGDRVVEIGPGTGQATIALAERGLAVVAVELGEALAAVARRNLARHGDVEIRTGDFDEVDLEPASFDAVAAFTSFHWLDPATRLDRCARLLRRGGALAVVATQHVLPEGGDPFFVAVQDAYAAAGEKRVERPPRPEEVPDIREELVAAGRFAAVDVRRYLRDVEYDADAYIDVLETYSGHRALEPATRERLYTDIRGLIGTRTIRKSYLFVLHVACCV